VSVEPPRTDTPARARLAAALLAWGRPRPLVPVGLAAELRQVLRHGAQQLSSGNTVTVTAGRPIVPVPGPATPFVHDRGNVRGALTQAAVERDLLDAHRGPTAAVVGAVWDEAASRAPGDPRSRSWWLNHLPRPQADDLRAELVDLLDGFREVWPALPAAGVVVRPARTVHLDLLAGRVSLRGRIGPRIDSVRVDDRARVLLLDLRTSRPRPDHDRRRLRELALLETLATDRPPFRWASLHLTDGRAEVEDLDPEVLQVTARSVAERFRLADEASAPSEGQRAGDVVAPPANGMSHGGGTMPS
jgi:hypothetical protein